MYPNCARPRTSLQGRATCFEREFTKMAAITPLRPACRGLCFRTTPRWGLRSHIHTPEKLPVVERACCNSICQIASQFCCELRAQRLIEISTSGSNRRLITDIRSVQSDSVRAILSTYPDTPTDPQPIRPTDCLPDLR